MFLQRDQNQKKKKNKKAHWNYIAVIWDPRKGAKQKKKKGGPSKIVLWDDNSDYGII